MQSRFTKRQPEDTIGAPTVPSLLLRRGLYFPSSSSTTKSATEKPPPPPPWDFVVLQDDEQYVTNDEWRNISLQALRRDYLPTLLQAEQEDDDNNNNNNHHHHNHQKKNQTTIVLLLETFAYRSTRLRAQLLRLGNMDEFTAAIVQGMAWYQQVIAEGEEEGEEEEQPGQPPPQPQRRRRPCFIVPMASAVQYISNAYPELFRQLYNDDNVHPSPHGTWLQACLLVAMATRRAPPVWEDDDDDDHDTNISNSIRIEWQSRARHWSTTSNSGDDETTTTTTTIPLPVPTAGEAELLRQVACQFAGVACGGGGRL
jgi:hypothetical protein